MAWGKEEKTEPATPKRREEAREKGHVPKSREVTYLFSLLGATTALYFFGPYGVKGMSEIWQYTLTDAATMELVPDNILPLLKELFGRAFLLMAPLVGFSVVAAIAAEYMQVGFLLTSRPLIPQISRINPIQGFQRIFSAQSFRELLKGILKLLILGYVGYITIKAHLPYILSLTQCDLVEAGAIITKALFSILYRSCLVLAGLAVLDYLFQRWDYEKGLRMSKEELKEELKQREGDPIIRARIKSIQRDIARRRMMASVPNADVIITNPTHIAVALEYSRGKIIAPRIVAKGGGFIAEKIIRIAKVHGIPIVEDKPLAHALFRLKLGDAIPEELYKAVAEILVYIYQMKGRSL